MPFTHKVLAYCDTTKELKDSGKLEEKAALAVEMAKEYAESLSTEDCDCTWRPIVRVEVVPASN